MMVCMDYYLFGYGSLINPQSIALTLGRKVHHKELTLVEISGYCRSWNLVVPVVITDENQNSKPINAVFLDLQKRSGMVSNGVIFKVGAYELANMDIREKQYNRIDVTSNISHIEQKQLAIFTYVGKPDFFVTNYSNPKILKRYYNIILQGLEYWGKDFAHTFNQTTEPHNFETIEGLYKFLDDKQNILTGHD
jgi:cation transport regulator ChaC